MARHNNCEQRDQELAPGLFPLRLSVVPGVCRRYFLIPAILGILLAAPAQAQSNEQFRAAMSAFRLGNYGAALKGFLSAQKAGVHSVSLYFNLGSTYFKLGQWDQAARAFSQVVGDAQWGCLAEYNLGLIAERQGKPALARHHYERAAASAPNAKLRALVQAKLQPQPSTSQQPQRWSRYLSLGLGRDDNPGLRQDEIANGSGASDTYLETLANLSRYLDGNSRQGTRVNINLYDRRYSDESAFNLTGVDLGIYRDRNLSAGRASAGVHVGSYWVGGEAYTQTLNGLYQHQWDGQAHSWLAKAELSYVQASDSYKYLQGWREQLNLELRGSLKSARWRLGGRAEMNQREDLASTDGQFFDYSPSRLSAYAVWRQPLNPHWSLEGRSELRLNRYSHNNLEYDAVSDSLVSQKRSDRQQTLGLELNYAWTQAVSGFVGYHYLHSHSSIDRYSYSARQWLLGGELVF